VSCGYSSVLKWYITNVLGKLSASFHIIEGKIFLIVVLYLDDYKDVHAACYTCWALRVCKEHLELTFPTTHH
jgi:hypothetical protein